MATYTELYDLNSESALKNRVLVACLIAAETVMNEADTVPNHANRLIWAKNVFENPNYESQRMYWALLAANNALSTTQIKNATDAAILTEVEAHIDLFAA